MPSHSSKPQNYFLNESHELSVEEKKGFGRQVEYPGISWPQKALRLHNSLERVSQRANQSRDPLSKRRFYLIADPFGQIVKASKAQDQGCIKLPNSLSSLAEVVVLLNGQYHPRGT